MFVEKIVEGDFSETEIRGYKRSTSKLILTWTFYILSLFFLRLVFHWLPRWYIFMSHTRCSLQEADVVLCKDQYCQYWIHKVKYSLKDGTRNNFDNLSCLSSENSFETKYDLDQVWRFFEHKKIKYLWDYDNSIFYKLQGLEQISCSNFYRHKPLKEEELSQRKTLYGENFIDVKITPLLVLLFREGLNPFYIFQIFSCTLWFLEYYNIYACCILFMSALSLSIEIYDTRKNETTLRNTVVNSGESLVCRNGKEYQNVNSKEMVPGDVIYIPNSGCLMHCDAVLIAGNCIVNESMLTGESVPVTKTPLPNHTGMIPFSEKEDGPDNKEISKNDELFEIKKHNRHILFCGTKIIQARNLDSEPILAVVIRTGYLTAKGELVRSILFPKPIDIKFNRDAMKFIMVLFLFSLIGFMYSVIIMVRRNIDTYKIIIRSLDLITIVVPPALPIAMTIGIVFAQSRLKKKDIFCISPNTINTCGGINISCFDKTGTLTEDGLDLWGVVASKQNGTFDDHTADLKDLSSSPLVEGMATCHSLTFIDGNLSGDPIDLKMFQSTDWLLRDTEDGEENVFEMSVAMIAYKEENHNYSIGILRQFPFSSSLQRMAVITKLSNKQNFSVYVKGSPERIFSLCLKETIPQDFNSKLLEFTRKGYRVLALAYRQLEETYSNAMRIPRHEVECDLRFSGFLIMENRLKPETEPVIKELKEANIRPIMITGDNMLTALSVSRDCRIIENSDNVVLVDARMAADNIRVIVEFHYTEDLQRHTEEKYVTLREIISDSSMTINIFQRTDFHLALSGRTWRIIKENCPQLIPKLVEKGSVFARFAPEQKAQVIEALQSVGYYVSMCGDGANDCGALKVAHAGISLSEAEASVASPFTSKVQNITCVPVLIKEGRCALATSFGTFKFMAGYSFTQFISVLILYWINGNLGDYQFLYIDLVLLTTLSLTYGYTEACKSLSVNIPSVRLLTAPMIMSLVSQWILNTGIQVAAYLYVFTQPWYYIPSNKSNKTITKTFAVTAVFVVSIFQYIILAFVFSKGPPFRERIYTNCIFLWNIIVLIVISLYIAIYPFQWLRNLLDLVSFPTLWVNCILFSFVFGNFLLAYLIELVIEETSLCQMFDGCKDAFFPEKINKGEYERIKIDISSDAEIWPPIIVSASVQDMRPDIFTDVLPKQFNNKEGEDDSLALHPTIDKVLDTNLKIN